jgi:hypothetical protein
VRDWFYPFYCGAGRGARSKYDEVSGRWRKRIFRGPRLISVGLALPILIAAELERHHVLLLMLGVLFGCLWGAFVALLESPPGRIENWRTGYEGERRTARALAPLRREGHVLLHDLPDRRGEEQNRKGNIDHVVVSPSGVFLLDTKWLGGEASIERDTVHVQMRDDDDDSYQLPKLASGVRGSAVRLQEDIVRETGVRWVQPVVVFWNRFQAGRIDGENIVFIHGDCLVDWLRQPESKLTPETVANVAACIKDVRPTERRGWWTRLPTLRLGGRRKQVAPTSTESAAREG